MSDQPPAKRRRMEEEGGGTAASATAVAQTAMPPVDSTIVPELKPVFQQLTKWFREYGNDPALEIEARLKNIEEHEFSFIVRTLDSFKGWSQLYEETTMDIRYASGVRQTVMLSAPPPAPAVSSSGAGSGAGGSGTAPAAAAAAPVYLAKSTLEKADYSMPGDGLGLRIAVNAEDHCAPPSVGSGDFPDSYRHKRRLKFVHRGEIAYDCTVVKMGADEAAAMAAKPIYEVEIEWCGQEKVKAALLEAAAANKKTAPSAPPASPSPYSDPALLAAKFTLKVQDLHNMRRQAAAMAKEEQRRLEQQRLSQQAQTAAHYHVPMPVPVPVPAPMPAATVPAPP